MQSASNPFDILPANLFSTQGYATLQRHYIALLLRINVLAEYNRHGLTREAVIAAIADYLMTERVEVEVAAAMAAEESGAATDVSRDSLTARRRCLDGCLQASRCIL